MAEPKLTVWKPVRTRKDGNPDKRFVEDPLLRVVRRRLDAIRNERLSFVVVGDPAACVNGCWQQKAAQAADAKALKALGDSVPEAQFPMLCLRMDSELTENYRGYVMRCHCMSNPIDQATESK
jgi:hypothetical protein